MEVFKHLVHFIQASAPLPQLLSERSIGEVEPFSLSGRASRWGELLAQKMISTPQLGHAAELADLAGSLVQEVRLRRLQHVLHPAGTAALIAGQHGLGSAACKKRASLIDGQIKVQPRNVDTARLAAARPGTRLTPILYIESFLIRDPV
jgi:hypothetical protein